MTQGRASYTMEFADYSKVPKAVEAKIVTERGGVVQDDDE